MEMIIQNLSEMEKRGIRLNEQDGNIKYHAPKGALTPEDIQFLKANKSEIIKTLKHREGKAVLQIDPEQQYEPFPLTGIQEAYFLGRNNTYQYGGVSCHIYMEIEYPFLDPDSVEEVWNQLIDRHGMLKTVFIQEGYQQELPEVPYFQIIRANGEQGSLEIRSQLADKMYPVDRWPLFDIGVSDPGDCSILHYSTEFLIVDWTSIWMLLSEFEAIYFRQQQMPKLKLGFRDYVLAERQMKHTLKYKRDQQYWLERIPDIKAAPKLPQDHSKQLQNTFRRMQMEITPERWEQIKAKCKSAGVTPTSYVLAAYAKVLARYSETDEFTINMIMLNRQPLHEQVNQIIGDFTSNTLIPVTMREYRPFFNEVLEINQAVFEALDHGLYSGVEILRELSRQKGREAAFMPIIFTSAIGISSQNDEITGKIRNTGISQTPQAFVDCQVMDGAFGLRINWDVREGIFYDGYLEDMFQTFETVILEAASPETNWENEYSIALPEWQQLERKAANQTDEPVLNKTLHQLVLEQAQRTPKLLAAADCEHQFSYHQLIEKSKHLAFAIKEFGLADGAHIGIIMPKNIYQIVAALGTLLWGGVFVPIDDSEAFERTEAIIKNADIDLLLVHSRTRYQGSHLNVIVVDQLEQTGEKETEVLVNDQLPAYIIYTSGSTGIPKGVVISHKAAVNTICDVNGRFGIGEGDRVLGLSQLNFDLSVYDIFGMLSAGGAVIYPDNDKYSDPSHWVRLIEKYRISVWNSVPSLLVMLQEYLQTKKEQQLDFMRVVLLSGDWIPLLLPQKMQPFLPSAEIVSLGGATEAAIWSIYHEYRGLKPDWVSIPYGKPLANQQIHILNKKLEESPVWLKGDLYISGEGLGMEYYGDKDKTDEQFFFVPSLGKRVYRTGDMGRYMPGGEIEFLGREDKQIKILGFRIELGEIESSLKRFPGVEGAMAVTMPVGNMTKIIGITWGDETGLKEAEIKDFLKDKIPSYMVPYRIIHVEQVPLTANGKIDRKTIENLVCSQIDSVSSGPEQQLMISDGCCLEQIKSTVCRVMELQDIGIHDDLYGIGADSLIMNRLAASLTEGFSQYYDFEEILIQLLNYPTIEAFSQFIERSEGKVS
ncbi:amino acid adenylation domain-containing protein [Lacrimispora brassicae]